MNPYKIVSQNEEDTIKIAETIALFLQKGDILVLDGDLGTGKTLFVKALTAALGSIDKVTSPTFTIAHFYRSPKGQILHIDAYRLTSLAEFSDTGLMDFFEESTVLVEWGTKIADLFETYFLIAFEYSEANKNERKITISYTGDTLLPVFNGLTQRLSALGN